MKISLEWLKEYVLFDLSAQQVGDILSDRGFPIENIESVDDDWVLDVELTSNRGDCASHIGIARELACALRVPLRVPPIRLPEPTGNIRHYVQVRIDQPAECGRYVARVIEDVRIGPSPDWLRRRLEKVGLRSVNNVVDATNYAMMEHGQPPHAFDYHTIEGKQIIVRRAKAGEKIVSISGADCQLTETMLVIADAAKPIAIAGVMGGLATEVSDKTTTILLEEAHFDPVCIRRTSRQLALASEASYRFERQVDIANIDWASQRCAQLILSVAGGRLIADAADCWPQKQKKEPLTVPMRWHRLESLLGVMPPKSFALEVFQRLGFEPHQPNENLVVCTVPSWRHDISRECDLIEEVARCWGYNKIPVEKKIRIEVVPPAKKEQTLTLVANWLTGCGFYEAVCVSFISPKTAQIFSSLPADKHLAAIDAGQNSSRLLRQNLIGSLVEALQTNANAGNRNVRLFEIADTFVPSADATALPTERLCVGLAGMCDFRTLRGVVEGLCQRVCRQAIRLEPMPLAWAKAAGQIFIDNKPLGIIGVLSPKVAAAYDLDRFDIAAAQLDFETLLEYAGKPFTVKPLPKFPSIVRDLSVIVDKMVQWKQICNAIEQAQLPDLEKVEFVDLYCGKPIPPDKKSITFSLHFRDENGTLRHEQVDAYQNRLVELLAGQLGAVLRTA